MLNELEKHNKNNKVVHTEWLNKNKRATTSSPDTWVYLRIKYENGKIFTLTKDEWIDVCDKGFELNWCFL